MSREGEYYIRLNQPTVDCSRTTQHLEPHESRYLEYFQKQRPSQPHQPGILPNTNPSANHWHRVRVRVRVGGSGLGGKQNNSSTTQYQGGTKFPVLRALVPTNTCQLWQGGPEYVVRQRYLSPVEFSTGTYRHLVVNCTPFEEVGRPVCLVISATAT